MATLVALFALGLAACSGPTTTSSAPPPTAAPATAAPPAGSSPPAVTARTISITDPKVGPLTFDAIAAGDPARATEGKLVLLLHGFPETSESYRDFLGPLADAGYYAVAPDQRGYSATARPTRVDDYGILELTNDVTAMATALGAEGFHVVGHDWGGAVAWVTARVAPTRVETLTVLSTPHPDAMTDAYNDPNGEQSKMSGYMQVFRSEGEEDRILANGADSFVSLFSASGMPVAKARAYAEVLGTPAALGAALNWYRANPLPSIVRLGAVETNTLFVWGSKDMALGPTAAKATGTYVHGPYDFETLDGKGHWLPEDATTEILPLLLPHLAQA